MKNLKIINDSSKHDGTFHLNPIIYMLKTYHDHFGKSKDDYKWIRYDQDLSGQNNVNIIASKIIEEKIDIICFSVYIWNNNYLNQLAKKVKDLDPNITVIMGGPDLTAKIGRAHV